MHVWPVLQIKYLESFSCFSLNWYDIFEKLMIWKNNGQCLWYKVFNWVYTKLTSADTFLKILFIDLKSFSTILLRNYFQPLNLTALV